MKTAALLLACATTLGACASRPAPQAALVQLSPSTSAGAIVARAEEALSAPASTDWRPALRADLERYLNEVGALSGPTRSLLNDSATWSGSSNGEGTTVTGPMVAALNARRTLIITREAEFDTLDSSIVVSLGDLRARSIRNCILFVMGRAEADQIDAATICARGQIEARTTRDSAVVAIHR